MFRKLLSTWFGFSQLILKLLNVVDNREIYRLAAVNFLIYPMLQVKFSNSFLKISIKESKVDLIIPLIIIFGLSFLVCLRSLAKTKRISPCLFMKDSSN